MNTVIKKILRKILFLTMISFSFSLSLFSQEPLTEEQLDSLIDDLFFTEDEFIDDVLAYANKYNLLYSGFTINSNTFIYGREPEVDQFNIIPFLSYYNSKGFNASVSGIFYGESTPNWDLTNISLGYGNYFGKKDLIHTGISYSRDIYTEYSDYLINSIDAIVGFQTAKRTFGTKLCGSLLFGNGSSFQLISKTDYKQTLLKNYKFILKLKPQISFVFSDRTISSDTFSETYFGFLYSQFNFPMNFITKKWDIEAGYIINYPIAHELEADLKPTGFFRFSLGYILDFTK